MATVTKSKAIEQTATATDSAQAAPEQTLAEMVAADLAPVLEREKLYLESLAALKPATVEALAQKLGESVTAKGATGFPAWHRFVTCAVFTSPNFLRRQQLLCIARKAAIRNLTPSLGENEAKIATNKAFPVKTVASPDGGTTAKFSIRKPVSWEIAFE